MPVILVLCLGLFLFFLKKQIFSEQYLILLNEGYSQEIAYGFQPELFVMWRHFVCNLYNLMPIYWQNSKYHWKKNVYFWGSRKGTNRGFDTSKEKKIKTWILGLRWQRRETWNHPCFGVHTCLICAVIPLSASKTVETCFHSWIGAAMPSKKVTQWLGFAITGSKLA